MYFSKTITDPRLGEIHLRKQKGIRNIRLSVHPRRGIVINIPWRMSYSDGLDFMQDRMEWILSSRKRQQTRINKARNEGRGMPIITDGVSISTIHQEIIIRRSPQGTLFSFNDTWDRPIDTFGKPTSKRRGTISQDSRLLTTEHFADSTQSEQLTEPEICGVFIEGSRNRHTIAVTRITYPDQWGERIEPQSVEDRMISDAIIKVLRKEAKIFLPQYAAYLAGRYGFSFNKITIKNNLTNWGSCSTKGNINLNLHLVRIPRDLCDYVILHELCHLKEMNHGEGFHKLFEDICSRHFSGRLEGVSTGNEIEKRLRRELHKYYLW